MEESNNGNHSSSTNLKNSNDSILPSISTLLDPSVNPVNNQSGLKEKREQFFPPQTQSQTQIQANQTQSNPQIATPSLQISPPSNSTNDAISFGECFKIN